MLKTLLRREEEGRPVPELLDRPALSKQDDWLMDAFERLSTERQMGFGSWGSIPHSKVVAEALRLGLGDDGLHELWTVISALDEQWRSVANAPKPGAEGGRLPHQDSGGPKRSGKRKPRSGS